MKKFLFFTFLLVTLHLQAQNRNYYSVAFTNNASSYPLNTFAGFFKAPFHPGIELGWSRNFKEKIKHDWFRDVKLGYFYHRFVQHGIPIYLNYGYRYKFSKQFYSQIALGGGYFHSIPATEVLKLNDNGDYKNAKGIGRPQALFALSVGTGYVFKLTNQQPLNLFLQYQARIQTPFVKSYVPILPYNQLAIGASFTIQPTKKTK
jgi:hypothetical protein